MSDEKKTLKVKSYYPISDIEKRYGDKLTNEALEQIEQTISPILTFNFGRPIGKVTKTEVNKEKGRIEFEYEIHDEKIREMIDFEILKGVSIGGQVMKNSFTCKACNSKSDNIDNFCGNCGSKVIDPICEIEDFELHQVSLVNIPAFSKDNNLDRLKKLIDEDKK